MHRNPENNLHGGIKEGGKWQTRWKNLYVGHALIEFLLPLLMAAGVAVSLAVVFGDCVSGVA